MSSGSKTQNNGFTPHSVNITKSDEIPATTLELATKKCTELIEQLAEVDGEITEPFLNSALEFSPDILRLGLQETLRRNNGVCAHFFQRHP